MHDIFNKDIGELTHDPGYVPAGQNLSPKKIKANRDETKSAHEAYLENLKLAEEGKEIINFIGAINLILLMAAFYFVIERLI